MGIYDREYYRDEDTPFWGGFGRSATVWLIVLLAGAWLAVVFSRDVRAGTESPLFDALALDRPALQRGQVWRLVTAPVLYRAEALVPLVVGLFTLYFTGTLVESAVGFRGLLGLFGAGAVLATVAQAAVWAVAPDIGIQTAFGPAGGLLAVLTAYGLLFRESRVLLMFVLPVPGWVFALLFGAVILFGRIGGVYAPAALLMPAAATAVWVQSGAWKSAGRGGPRLKLFRPKAARPPEAHDTPVSSKPAGSRVTDEQLEAQIDRVLEKVSSRGQDSLTAEERAILVRGSEAYRRRRGRS